MGIETLFDTLLDAKENKKEILLLLYDLSAAFDCISHEMLIKKMEIYGFSEHAIKWLKSYLDSREQLVAMSGKMSSAQIIDIGTPQGSRLSPLLFICIMADLNLWTLDSGLSNFADDTQSVIISEDRETALETTKREERPTRLLAFFQAKTW